jgi:hypothetical protein
MRQGTGCKGDAGRRGKGKRQRVKRKREEGRQKWLANEKQAANRAHKNQEELKWLS